jgi:ribosome biogenesis GTPase
MDPVLFEGAAHRGMVMRCSRNSFTVSVDRDRNFDGNIDGSGNAAATPLLLECNIKGKILKGAEGFYNPLAPGDMVFVQADPVRSGAGRIVSLEKRRNVFSRFNQKGQSPQLLAANVDLALCLTTAASPPFRPRFLDRAHAQADAAGIEPLIVCNKIDLGVEDIDVDERLEDFRRIGYQVFMVSAKTGEGIAALLDLIRGKYSVLIGQSGVGKSSLINALFPGSNIKTGSINEKYDRGNHTTVMPQMLEFQAAGSAGIESSGRSGYNPPRIIDTPGIRRFAPDGIAAGELILHLREFAPLAGSCTYGLSCSHRIEPGCKIMEAVHAGVIHEDRYTSFLRMHDELSGKSDKNHDD